MKNAGIYRRTAYSLAGLRAAWGSERSFRCQGRFSAGSIVAFVILQPPAIWWMAGLLALSSATAAELVNGALEAMIDHLYPGIHPQIRKAKDIASAAAFVLNCTSVAVIFCVVSIECFGFNKL